MDVYFEHLVSMKKDSKSMGMLVIIWGITLLISAAAVFFLWVYLPLCIILVGVAVYGAVQLSKKLNGEYEYIFTNGEIDIDIITAKSDRRRIITFNADSIERVERYNSLNPLSTREKFDRVGMYCNKDDDFAYSLVIKHKTEGKVCVTMDIPKKMQEKMLPFMNKLVVREAFKD